MNAEVEGITRSNARAVQKLVHPWHDGQRTHHHVTRQESDDQSRRPTIAMDYNLMKMKSVANAQTMLEESVTCIAVKEDRHQNGSRRTVDN